MVCACCRQPQQDVVGDNYNSNGDHVKSPKAVRMERSGNDNDEDDDSDKQAVKWFRNRSFERNNSNSFDETHNLPPSKIGLYAKEAPVAAQDVETSDSQALAPARTRSIGPVDIDGVMDMEDSSTSNAGSRIEVLQIDSAIDVESGDEIEILPLNSNETEETPPKPPQQEEKRPSPKPQTKRLTSGSASKTEQTLGDDVTREKIDEARQLLRKSLAEKKDVLTKAELSFLDSLVTSIDEADDNLEKLSDVESAVNVLENDPLFQDSFPASSSFPKPAPVSASVEPPQSPKSSSQRKPQLFPKDPFSSLSVSKSNSQEPKLSPKSGSRSINPGASKKQENDNWWNFKDDKEEPPQLVEDDKEVQETPSKRPKKEEKQDKVLVRLDGWAKDKGETGPYRILGTSYDDHKAKPHVLSPLLMEALRGFLPFVVSEENFWLKYSLVRDGASLHTLLSSVRASSRTIVGIETIDGDVFGSFTGSPWRVRSGWFGSGDAFLWRLKKSRFASPKAIEEKPNFDSEMEVYPYTGSDNLIQFCTATTIAIGGGDYNGGEEQSPHKGEPSGIGLMIDGDLAGGETNSSATFANPRLCTREANKNNNEFDISNLEVWTLTPCWSEEEAEKLELRKLFVEEHRSFNS